MIEKKKPGRPKQRKLISIDKALVVIKNYYLSIGVGEDEVHKKVPARGTIYNKICKGIVHNYGSRDLALLDEDEVTTKLCS